MELREERIHLVTIVFPGDGPPTRVIGMLAGRRMTFLVDARAFGAWEEGDDLTDGDLHWLRPGGEFDGRRAVVAAKEVRRRCFRMRGPVEKVGVPVAQCDWYRDAAATAGYAVEIASYGEVERIVARRQPPCDPRRGPPLARRLVTFRVANPTMSGDLRRWSGNAEIPGQVTIETSIEVMNGVGATWDAPRAAASWPSAGPLSEFVGGHALAWTEYDDMYATCTGSDGSVHAFPDAD